jgi:hypothetical protein
MHNRQQGYRTHGAHTGRSSHSGESRAASRDDDRSQTGFGAGILD